jgi:hypothetical protein
MSASEKKTSTLPAVLALIAAVLALTAAVFSWMGVTGGEGAGRTESVHQAVAALEARALWREAIDELDAFRRSPGLARAEQAESLYKMASIADLNMNDCARALGWYTQAKALAPAAKWVAEADKRSMVCMENTGRPDQAQALLNQLTGGEEGTPGGKTVVAVIDGHSVTWEQVQSALLLSTKPEEMAKPEVRSKMLQEYVFVAVLAAEAMKKGYDGEAAIKAAEEQGHRTSLAALYLRRSLGDSPKPEEQNALASELLKQHQVKIFNDAIPKP